MKRLPIAQSTGQSTPSGDTVWYQTVAERDNLPAAQEARVREFTNAPYEPPSGVDRRTFMALMGASMALGGLASGCRRPVEKILPFSHMPEGFVPGQSEHYATAVSMYGTAFGLLVESYDGRPVKIEGNPEHPETRGGSTAFMQAAILDLYDPDRSKGPRKSGADVSADEAWAFIAELSKTARAKKGRGLAVLVGEHNSLTTAKAIDALLRDQPEAKAFRWEAHGRHNQREGVALAFGAAAADGALSEYRDVSYDFELADVVMLLDSDLLGCEGNPVKNSKGFSKRRRAGRGAMSRVYAAEPCPSITGHMADHRVRVQARSIGAVLVELGAALAQRGVPVADGLVKGGTKLGDKIDKWIAAAADDLAKAKGKSIVAVGNRQPAAVHALCAAINHALGNIGTTVNLTLVTDHLPEGPTALAQLVADIKSGAVDTLIMFGGNPAFDAPADLAFDEVLKNPKLTSIHFASYVDETGELSTWHMPRAHFLESWSDARSDGGVCSVVQPLIAPLYGGRTDAEVLHRLVGGTSNAFALVENTWGAMFPSRAFEKSFQQVIHDGFFVPPAEQTTDEKPLALNAAQVGAEIAKIAAPAADFEVVFAVDAHTYDGRFANNAWLQELPDPIHKGTWMSMAAISAATAKKLNVENGDVIDVTVGQKTVSLPVVVSFGSADDSVTIPLGNGRRMKGRVCSGAGVNTYPLRASAAGFAAAQVKRGAGHERLAITQGHFIMEGRPLIRTQTVEEHKADPSWARNMVKHPPLLNLFRDWEYKGHKWGMAIDLTLCNGCSACVTACQSENNIPVVGIDGVLKSREMHWLRIDRYFAGNLEKIEGDDEANAAFMPMTCQHCENAPCEQVCPVAATTHSPEGINEMTYNRCIGTKYCGNNCPYKVRRFNFFNYNKEIPETVKLGLNPEVTVRFRGIMEKCTFCVQRVNAGKIQEKIALDKKQPQVAQQVIRGIQTACMQACSMEAITFGDLNDTGSEATAQQPGVEGVRANVRHLADSGRAYAMLEEINVRPRISYLARIRNPNPGLEPPKAAAPEGHAAPGKESH
jgi:Fe-S-cluster-containing dehydrogenase component/anaerobic selenocysteine-containing dehydrogenase